MLSPPPIRAMSTPALLALLLGEEAATRLAGRSLIEIFALHAGRTLLNEVHAGYGPERTLEACKELMARALAETMRLGDCLSDPATVRDYLKARQTGKFNLNRAMRRRVDRKLGPERGLGARVFIGFDAEWTRARKGRNKILSVQFYLIGPTGEVLTLVIHIENGDILSQRPKLSDVINDLLESALDQGVIEEWPAEAVLCGFFTRADITCFSDFKHLRPQLDGVGGTLVTVGKAAKFKLPMSSTRCAVLKQRYQSVVGDEFEPHLLNLRLIDASRLAPPGKSLANIGQWLGIPKNDLPEGYDKSNMTPFQRERREEFEAYGLRDAEIAVMYVLWVIWFSTRHLGLDMRHISATASGLAVRIGENCIRKDGVALDVALNYEVKQVTRWDNATGVAYTQKKRLPKRNRKWQEPDTLSAYESTDTLLADSKQTFPPEHHGDDGYRLFESFAIFIREMRSPYIRKTLPFEFVKLLGNSLYGKTGQGFKGKRAFGVREMGGVIVGPSRISEAAVAALVCGFIRAVIAEILWKLPKGTTVVSATTDGFLVDCPIEQLDLSGTMCRRFQALVDRVSPGSHMLENKHQVMQLFAGRTRLQFTVEADGDHKTVTAKGGIKPGPDVKDENAFMLDLTLNRLPGQKLTYESFISMRDQLPLELDLQTETRETRINLEYDFKRRPISSSVRMIPVAGTGQSHLAFNTEPWNTVDEALTTRLIFDAWRDDHCLKTIEDFQTWEYYRTFRMANLKGAKPATPSTAETGKRTGRKNLTKGGYLTVAKQIFLAAYQKKMWGLDGVDLSQRKLAEWLTSQGYKTSVSAVKNGTREQPAEHLVPATDEVVAFLDKMKERFPGLETDKFLIR
jgi:hypothetical protein